MEAPFGKRLALALVLLLLLAAAPAALAAGPGGDRDVIPGGIPQAAHAASAAAIDATVTYVFGQPTATFLGTEATTSAHFTGSGAWRESLSTQKFELPIDPVALFGASFTIDEISSLTYHTNTVTPGAVDFFMTLYTVPCTGGNATWYCHRITAEPMYFNGFVTPTPGTWNTYSTNVGSNQFTFYDSNNNGGVFGGYPQPTLQDIQGGAITWSAYTSGGSSTPIDYGPETVKYIYLSTGSGTSATFDGYLDAVTISLTNGNTYNIDLEASVAEAWVDDDYTSAMTGWGVDHFASIQAGIDAVLAGGTVNVYPGTYNETATNRQLYDNGAAYQFGLFFADEKPGVTVQGLKADGSPITAYADVATAVTTNATNNFGTSGVFVEADNTTIAGLGIGKNISGDNKTIEIIGENFTLKNSVIDVPGGGSVYINDWRYNAGTSTSYVTKYTIDGNWLKYGTSVDVSSGAGVTGPVAGRKIINNKFTADGQSPNWALVSFNGTVPSVGWFVYPVGGATITGNDLSGSTQYIRSRGTVAGGFDWASYWTANTFDKAVVATTDGNPANPRPFNYTSGSSLINNTLRIGATIQPEVDIAQAGDTILVKAGSYTENVNVNKALKLRGATGGDFSSPVVTGATAAPGVWYTDRYAPAVFESYNFGGEMVLRHGVRVADSAANRPPAYSGTFYNTQGRKYDTNLTGSQQSFTIDLWVDSTWGGAAQQTAGVWSTGFSGVAVSAYPILAFRNVAPDVPGFYAYDYINGGYILLQAAAPADYGKWHTLSFTLSAGTGVEYLVDGQSKLLFADADTTTLGNLILNVYNFGADYDVYWDNFKVGSATPTPYEPVVTGVMNITAGNVEVAGLYLTNPGQTNAVVIANTASNVKIANNRIQGVGSTAQANNVHAIIMSDGADQVAITNNSFSNIKAGTKSVSAIGVLDSTANNASEGLLVEGNTFSDIASTTKGAYGMIINNKIGAPGAQIKNNTFSGLSGGWTHAIGLEGPTPNAVVSGNSFSGLIAAGPDNIAVHFEKNPVAATVVVTGNQFNGGGYYGVAVNPDDMAGGTNGLCYSVNAENNWWNSANGPTGAGAALAGPQVDYSPWWADAAGTSTASSGSSSDAGFVVPAGASTATQNTIIACAEGKTVTYLGNPAAGGVVVNTPNVTINLNGFTVGAGSPAFTVNADDFTLLGPGTLDGNGSGSPAVLVNAGADNFTLKNVEVRKWADGVQIAGDVVSLKIVDNFIHDNTGAGLQIDAGVAIGGVINIYGNLFKVNGGNGIQNDGATVDLPAQYNSWGHISGSAAPDGDGVSTNVDASNPTYLEYFIDMDPNTLATERRAGVGTSFDVMVKGDARKVNGISFKVAYNSTVLQLTNATYQGVWAGATCLGPTLATGSVKGTCYLQSGDWNGDAAAIMKLTFTVLALPSSPYPSALDILHGAVDTNAGAYGGAKVYVNNAGYGLPSVPARDITDTDDGTLTLGNLANYTGFIDLQGRANDSGGVLLTKNVANKLASVSYASGTSVPSGAYTTAHLTPRAMFQGETFWLQVDRALYLPTTQMGTTPSDGTVPGSWVHSKPLSAIPTPLLKVELLGGDGTDDDVIDVLDAGCMGSSYYVASTCTGGAGANSDVNGDGVTDILDLSLMGGNFYKVESPWTP